MDELGLVAKNHFFDFHAGNPPLLLVHALRIVQSGMVLKYRLFDFHFTCGNIKNNIAWLFRVGNELFDGFQNIF